MPEYRKDKRPVQPIVSEDDALKERIFDLCRHWPGSGRIVQRLDGLYFVAECRVCGDPIEKLLPRRGWDSRPDPSSKGV